MHAVSPEIECVWQQQLNHVANTPSWCFTFRQLQMFRWNCFSYLTQGINLSKQGSYSFALSAGNFSFGVAYLFAKHGYNYSKIVVFLFGLTYPAFSVAVMDM